MKHSEQSVRKVLSNIKIYKELGKKFKDDGIEAEEVICDEHGKKIRIMVNTVQMNENLVKKVYDFSLIPRKESVNILVINQIEVLAELNLYCTKNDIGANVTYIQYEDERVSKTKDEKGVVKKFGYRYIHIKNNKKELEKLKMKKEFDVILANPPYQGQAKLHQKFFNAAFELLSDEGVMTFIQPSNPYITAFDVPKKGVDENKMRDIVVNNYSEVKLLSPLTFTSAALFYPLAVTTVIKNKPSFKGVDVFTDIECNTSANININDINTTETKPNNHRSMSDKVKAIVNAEISIKDAVFAGKTSELNKLLKLDNTKQFLKLPRVRGNTGEETSDGYVRNRSFYTWIPGDGKDGLPKFKKEKDNGISYGIIIDKNIDPKVAYAYFKTYFARYCMSLGKYNQSIDGGSCERTTPYLGFDKLWTDEELFAKAGFTDEEIAEVYRIIPSYY